MTHTFENLNHNEYSQLKDAIVWITILVAGADDHIDQEEKSWAEKLTKIRSYSNEEILQEFYGEVGSDFSVKLDQEISDLPKVVDERNQILGKRLTALNPILAKLDPKLGAALYQSYTSFAVHVAKASGGVLRFFTISEEESEVMGLDMIDEIIYEEE